MDFHCGCQSHDCRLTVFIGIFDAQWIIHDDLLIVVDGCPYGPEDCYSFAEKREGYTLYRYTRTANPAAGSSD